MDKCGEVVTIYFSEEVEIKMRQRSRKIAVIATVVFLLNLQWLISQITLENLMFLCERMMEDFVQESDSLLFLTALRLSVHR